MPAESYIVVTELHGPGFNAQLRNIPARATYRGVHTYDHNTLGLIIESPPGAMVRQGHCFDRIGRVLFHPRHVPWEFSTAQGSWTSVVCEFTDNEMFESIVGPKNTWARFAFDTSFNIRSPEIPKLLNLLELELRFPSMSSPILAESLVSTTLHYLSRYLRPNDPAKFQAQASHALKRSQMLSIEERLRDMTSGPPTIKELAALCGMSSRHLLRKFRNATGMTIGEYVAQSQLAKARHFLSETDLPIKAIAFQLGFKLQSSFSTAFRRATGKSPQHFRRLAQE